MNDYDMMPLASEDEARQIASQIERQLSFRSWVPCKIRFVDERREDRVADCTLDMEIRLFRGGQTVGTLLHEMAHNSINCLFELMMMSGIQFVSNGYDDSHTAHFEMMLEHLVGIYEGITATDRSPA